MLGLGSASGLGAAVCAPAALPAGKERSAACAGSRCGEELLAFGDVEEVARVGGEQRSGVGAVEALAGEGRGDVAPNPSSGRRR